MRRVILAGRLTTQVDVGSAEGLKHDSTIHCDELTSLPKAVLTDFVGSLPPEKADALDRALRAAVGAPCDSD